MRSLCLLLGLSLAATTVACGSGDEPDLATPDPPGATAAAETPSDDSPSGDSPTGGGTGTVTLSDGTVFDLIMSTCDTSGNGADGFTVENSYGLTGRTADDAFLVIIGRAGFSADSMVEIATIEGEFDENGRNATLIYHDILDTLALVVDGGHVTGTMSLKPIGPNKPYGDEVEATVDIRC